MPPCGMGFAGNRKRVAARFAAMAALAMDAPGPGRLCPAPLFMHACAGTKARMNKTK